MTGHGGTRPELQEPSASSVLETSLKVPEGAAAAAAAADAAAAASAAVVSARAAFSAVQDSLGSARRQRKRGRRRAKKFVGSALSRVWRARTGAQTSASALSPVAAKFAPAPRWGNSPMKRYPLWYNGGNTGRGNRGVTMRRSTAHRERTYTGKQAQRVLVSDLSPPQNRYKGLTFAIYMSSLDTDAFCQRDTQTYTSDIADWWPGD